MTDSAPAATAESPVQIQNPQLRLVVDEVLEFIRDSHTEAGLEVPPPDVSEPVIIATLAWLQMRKHG